MGAELTLADVFDMAVDIETDAEAFYAVAASASSDPTHRRVFGELAAMEEDHQLVFAAMRDQAATRATDRPAQQARELSLVAKLFASGVKEDLARRFTGRESARDILMKALGFEKDTIVFLLNVRNMLANSKDRSKVDEIVTEELGHVIMLSGALANPGLTFAPGTTFAPQTDKKVDHAT